MVCVEDTTLQTEGTAREGQAGAGKALGAVGDSQGLCRGAQEEAEWGGHIGFAGPCKGF